MSIARQSGQPKVFLSHSHKDRHSITRLQDVLQSNGAETYLDQDQIQAGDVLPNRIREGIEWCNTFLLCWSSSAALSSWVEKEWNMAYDQRKKIVPYLLDNTMLPAALENLVYVPVDDCEHGDAELLKAVLGRGYSPDPTTLFPGTWHATVDVSGVQATYNFELRANGQVEGDVGIDQSSGLGGLAGLFLSELGDTLFARAPLHGSWSYDQGTQVLTLSVTAMGATGQQNTEVVKIQATGREKGAIQGRDFKGNIWTLHRVS